MEDRISYTAVEAAKLMGVSRAFLYLLWADGKGPPRFKIGRRTLIARSDLIKWTEDQKKL